jgi:hypothetical protein
MKYQKEMMILEVVRATKKYKAPTEGKILLN